MCLPAPERASVIRVRRVCARLVMSRIDILARWREHPREQREMVENDNRLHASGAHRIDHGAVIHQGRNAEITLGWLDAAPLNGEPISVQTKSLCTLDRLDEGR
jgi:hypothetical protein